MPAWLRILLILFALFLVVVIAAGISGFYWYKKHGPALIAAGQETTKEGTAFGSGKSDSECVSEALRRTAIDSSFGSQIQSRLFVDACLRASKRSPELCAAVPPRGAIFRTATWSAAECARRGRGGDQSCSQIMQSVPEYCHSGSSSK